MSIRIILTLLQICIRFYLSFNCHCLPANRRQTYNRQCDSGWLVYQWKCEVEMWVGINLTDFRRSSFTHSYIHIVIYMYWEWNSGLKSWNILFIINICFLSEFKLWLKLLDLNTNFRTMIYIWFSIIWNRVVYIKKVVFENKSLLFVIFILFPTSSSFFS